MLGPINSLFFSVDPTGWYRDCSFGGGGWVTMAKDRIEYSSVGVIN